MFARKRLDIAAFDVFAALWLCAQSAARSDHARQGAQRCWRPDGTGLACLSVRSGFDLLLRNVSWPEGSEVLMSAVTIPDMPRLVRHHGFVPVPIDLDMETLAPNLQALEAAITPRTRAVVIAHLLGTRLDLEPFVMLARRHDLMLIEDCAQAFDGLDYTGHDGAVVSMFSFGTIKTATCAGGALLTVRDEQLHQAMEDTQSTYPVQSRGDYALKLLKMLAMLVLVKPLIFSLFVTLARQLGKDYDAVVRRMSRGFAGSDFFSAIRVQPCSALLQFMQRRIPRYDRTRLDARAEAGQRLHAHLAPFIGRFGAEARHHTHWLVPITVDNPEAVVAKLRKASFDATTGSSTLVAIEPDSDYERPLHAAQAMAGIVYLPVYAEVPHRSLETMATLINETAHPSAGLLRITTGVAASTPAY
jgi:perosamine synthetase